MKEDKPAIPISALLGSPLESVFEYDGTHLYFTLGTGRTQIDQQVAGGGANVALSNLVGVAINTSLLPAVSGTPDLGSTSYDWGNLFLKAGGVVNWNNGDMVLWQGGQHLASNIALGNATTLAGNNSGIAENVAIGCGALHTNTSGWGNTAVGHGAMYTMLSGDQNTCLGLDALYLCSTGLNNTAVGMYSGYNALGGNNVFLGYYAGAYETGNYSFYVDCYDRVNTAGDKAGAILYGVMNATAASQTLRINATVSVLQGLNPVAADGAALGTGTYMWSDLFLASGAVINFNNGNMTLTHSAATLTFAGGTVALGTGATATSPVFTTQITTPAIVTAVGGLVMDPTGKVLTNNTPTGLFTVALPTLKMAGGVIQYTIVSSDGTDMQCLSGVATYAVENKGGVYVTSITEVGPATYNGVPVQAVSVGTLTSAWTITTGTNVITINLNANSSLTPTTLKVYYTLLNGSPQAVTLI